MKLPIRNLTSARLTLFIEPYCDEYEVPAGGEAIVTVDDGEMPSLDVHPDNWVTLWDGGERPPTVDVVSKEQNAVIEALDFARTWFHHFGPEGDAAARDLDDAIKYMDRTENHVRARFFAYRAFREGYRVKAAEPAPNSAALPAWSGSKELAGAYRAGGAGAYFNYRVRCEPQLIELGEPPFDTKTARLVFEVADAVLEAACA